MAKQACELNICEPKSRKQFVFRKYKSNIFSGNKMYLVPCICYSGAAKLKGHCISVVE